MKQKGFTILYAVLVSSLVLALGLGIMSITLKEVQISGAGRDSQFAFYAADSGLECAQYWDSQGDIFATSTGFVSSSSTLQLSCADGQNIKTNKNPSGAAGWVESPDFSVATTTFWIYMATTTSGVDITKPCANVQVIKRAGSPQTTIDSRGYNSCDSSNPRRLERGYRIEY